MYEIPTTGSPTRPDLPPALVGLRWVGGYALLGCLGGAAAFLAIALLQEHWGWSADRSVVAAWSAVALVCAPLGVGLQHYLLQPFGMRFRAWIRGSWLMLAALAMVVGVGLAVIAYAAGVSPTTLFHQPGLLLRPLEALTGGAVAIPEGALVLGLRAGVGLLFGLAQARGWRSNRPFRRIWPLACAAAGLLSGYGEALGWRLAEAFTYRPDCQPWSAGPCSRWLNLAVGGALYWGATWLLMGLVTAGPVIYLVRCHQRSAE